MIRTLDIILSGLALLALSPLLLPLTVILKFSGEGEVFFAQSRVGRGGECFRLYKFATMLKDSPNIGSGTVTLKDDPRVLPMGKFLRATKINELPQLLNVILGDMSLIGPRPQTRRCFDAFSDEAQIDIKKVRPGLSGVGSIVFRNEEDMLLAHTETNQFYDKVIMRYKGDLESWYVRNNTVSLYFVLIVLTALVTFTRSTRIIYKCYASLPKPPSSLKPFIASDNYE